MPCVRCGAQAVPKNQDRSERKRDERWHSYPYARPPLRGLATAVLGASLALVLAGHASAATTTLNVNPVTGKDTNPGSTAAPLKTLGKALTLAHSGDTVKLAIGGYGPGFSGDQFPATGLVVPSGVTISGTTSDGFPGSTLIGSGGGVGLNLAGNATIRNVFPGGGSGFGVAIYAKQGKQNFSNLLLAANQATAVIDGAPTSASIVLRGTAQADLRAGATPANPTGTMVFVNAHTGVAIGQQARLTMHGGQLNLAAGVVNGVSVGDQGQFTMDGGKITGGAANCGVDATGIAVRDAAQATLQNGATLENVPGFGVFMSETAKATLNGATITREATAGCQGRPSIDARRSATLTTTNATIASTGGQDVDGIVTRDTVTVTQTNATVRGFSGNGIELSANEKLTIDGGSVNSNAIGIEARTPADNTGVKPTPHIKLTGATVAGNGIGIQVDEPILKLRRSSVVANQTGIEVIGEVGGLPIGDTCAFACVNLGTGEDPGNNDLSRNTATAVENRHSFGSAGNLSGVQAVGNFWNANTQGANADGHYLTPPIVRAGDPLAVGRNFELSGVNTLIQLAGSTVGRLHLAPAVVRARVGKTTRLVMRWTHPHSWKALKTLGLRVYHGAKAVGTITVRPHGERLSASGAIRLVADNSTLTHRGKTVTAHLALRLSRSLAGRRLRVDAHATDRQGHHQVVPGAGLIRVAK